MYQFDLNDHTFGREYRLADGSVEIGVYVYEVIERAGNIMVGVITHPANGKKWFWHDQKYNKKVFYTKRAAMEEADRASRLMDAYKEHEERIRYFETRDDANWENIAENH